MTAPEPTAPTPARHRGRRPRRTATLLGALVVITLGVPAAAQVGGFRDVDPGYVHADNVARLADAGISNGCGDGSEYCPTDPVTRGAMASFLGRSAGQVISERSVTTLAVGDGQVDGVPVTMSVTGAGESPGTQRISLQGAVTVLHGDALADCPCEVETFLYRVRDEAQGPSSWSVLSGEIAGDGGSVSLPVSWGTTIAAERREEYRVAVFVDGVTAPDLTAEASLTAVTAPFGRTR